MIKKVKIKVPRGPMLLVIITVKKLLELFIKKNCKKQIKEGSELKIVIKRKDDKLYVKRKG